MSTPKPAADTTARPREPEGASLAKRALRRITRHLRRRRRRSPGERWDRIYARNPRYTASGTLGVTEEDNARDFAIRLEILRTVIERHRRDAHVRLLDAGCGNGLMTREFVDLAFDVTGFDQSERAVADAKTLVGHRARLEAASLETFTADEPFDFVACLAVPMCITNDDAHARAFRNLASLVAPGGFLLIEDWLVPLATMGPEPEEGVLCRYRAIEVYERLARDARLDWIEHVRVHVPHANQDRSLLVFGRPPA